MIIRLPVHFEGSVREANLYPRFDCGATFSCIHPDFANKIGTVEKLFRPLEIATASDGVYMKIEERIITDFLHPGHTNVR